MPYESYEREIIILSFGKFEYLLNARVKTSDFNSSQMLHRKLKPNENAVGKLSPISNRYGNGQKSEYEKSILSFENEMKQCGISKTKIN